VHLARDAIALAADSELFQRAGVPRELRLALALALRLLLAKAALRLCEEDDGQPGDGLKEKP
jgi:hypothetical protein